MFQQENLHAYYTPTIQNIFIQTIIIVKLRHHLLSSVREMREHSFILVNRTAM